MEEEYPIVPKYLEEDEITVFRMTEKGDIFFLRETQRFIASPFHTCQKDQEPPIYKLPSKYPSIELTPMHILMAVVLLFFAFFVGRKTEKHRRAEERKKKKLAKREKRYKSNDQFLEERAKFFFLESYPTPTFKDKEVRSRKSSEDNIWDLNLENSNSLENQDSIEENQNCFSNSLIPYRKNSKESQNMRIIIEEESIEGENKSKIGKTFLLNWPLLDQKFSLNIDFTLKIENGVIKSLTTNNNVSLESFQKLMTALMEKHFLKLPKMSKNECAIKDPKNLLEPLFLTYNSHDEILINSHSEIDVKENRKEQESSEKIPNAGSSVEEMKKTKESSNFSKSSNDSAETEKEKSPKIQNIKMQKEIEKNDVETKKEKSSRIQKIHLQKEIEENEKAKYVETEKEKSPTMEIIKMQNEIEKNHQDNYVETKKEKSPKMSKIQKEIEQTQSPSKNTDKSPNKSKDDSCNIKGKEKRNHPLNEIKNAALKKFECVENEKSNLDEHEIKHFQFELFENGRFTKLFNLMQEIGKGAFGEVYKVIHKIENSIYAIKKVYLPLKVNEDIRTNKYFREVMLMTKFNHKNVIRYHTSWLEEPENDFKDQYLAKKKELTQKKDKKKKKRSESSSSLNWIEEQKEELVSNMSNNERTHLSSLGFEWVASEKNVERTSENKKPIVQHSKKNKSISRSSQSSIVNDYQKSSKNHKISRNSENIEHWSAIIDKMTTDQIPVVLFIQMHYSRQSLRNYLDYPTRKMDRLLNFQMFKQMIEGIKYIHSNGIIHRDLKPANIFVDEDNTILIGDFGLSVILQSNLTLNNNFSAEVKNENQIMDPSISLGFSKRHAQSLTKNIGTPLYLAPEQEKGQIYDEKVDIYALGLILLEMCTFIKTGHERFCMFNDIKKTHKIPDSLRKDYQQEADLILLMTNADPLKRPSSGEIEKCAEYRAWKENLNRK